jgi:hypothetical protein
MIIKFMSRSWYVWVCATATGRKQMKGEKRTMKQDGIVMS